MEETGIRLPGYLLDPQAEEFRPRNPSPENHFTLHHPQIYYSSYPPSTGMQVMPAYFDGVLGYHQSSSPTAYVRPNEALPPPITSPPLPPLSTAATRALLLTSVPAEVTEAIVRRDMEVFGEVRAVQMERLQDGIVTVHFYDLRHAQVAMKEIQEQHMQQQIRSRQHYNALLMGNNWENSDQVLPFLQLPPLMGHRGLIEGRVVWAQFTLPAIVPGHVGRNQGTLVVFNLDSGVSEIKLKELFEVFGPVKEIRETPSKKNQRFLEFFDIRDAARALSEMDGKEIHGKRVIIEFSRPGGHSRKSFDHRSTSNSQLPQHQRGKKSSSAGGGFCRYSSNNNLKSSNINGAAATAGITDSMSSMSLVGSGNFTTSSEADEKNYINNGSSKRSTTASNAKNKSKSIGAAGAAVQLERKRSSRSWKSSSSRQKSCLGANFLIDEAAIMESNSIRDTRTTVMIKNIPNKYSQKLLLNMLDNHCIHCNEQINDGDDQPLSSYDFLYLPIDFNNKCNVGYGFVNLTSPQAAWRLYKAFHLQPWEVFNSRKICEVTYARLQGLEALKEHFKNSKFACETEEYLPVVFSPPRDGKEQLTEPLAVGAIFANITTGSGNSSSSGSVVSSASNIQVHQQLHHPMGACR
ncbi:RNA recognition motif domain [Macleaya cordata]|uniref:RNA recognition motif domain n=1 Tax=Macleaya cordata TaxID=56857 RepID=A0A200RCU0_MACCD|nr:RNA recognition motif domain [Macleaya cordata]